MKNFRTFSPFKCFFFPLLLPGGLARFVPPLPPPEEDPVVPDITEDVDALIFILRPGPAVLEEVDEQLEEVLAGLAGSEDDDEAVELEGMRMGMVVAADVGVAAGSAPPPPPPPPPGGMSLGVDPPDDMVVLGRADLGRSSHSLGGHNHCVVTTFSLAIQTDVV